MHNGWSKLVRCHFPKGWNDMSNKKIVVLDGSGNDDDYVASPFSTLIDVL